MGRPARSAAPPSTSPPWLRWAWIATVLATCLVYAPALRAPFIFDDSGSIRDNVEIRALWPSSVPAHAPFESAISGRPVATFTFALNYAINQWLGIDQPTGSDGPNATTGYRVVNLLLHLLCGALLFGILRRTLRRQTFDARWAGTANGGAMLVTALWLLHPIQTEALDYIVQRTEILVSACYLGTLYASVRAWDAASPRARLAWCATAIVVCLLGMGSKEVMVSAPLIVVLYDRAFRLPSWREVFSARTGRPGFYALLAATSVWLVVLIAGGARSLTVGFHVGIPWYQYFYSQAWAILHYLRLVLWPHPLTLDYGEDPIHGWGGIPGLMVLTVFGVATILAWTRAARWGWFGFLGAWFFLLLAPSSSVVPISTEIAAERRIYLALAAVLMLVVIGAESLRRQWLSDAALRQRRALALGALSLIVLALAATTLERSRTYTSSEALWRGVVASAPANPRGYDNLATLLLQARPPRDVEAEVLLRRAIATDSTYPPAWFKLGLIAAANQRLDEAKALFEHAVKADPNQLPWRVALGNALVAVGEPERGIPYLEQATAIAPSDTALVDVANAYMVAGRLTDAASALHFAARYNASAPDVLSLTGAVMTEQGHAAEAIPYLQSAVAADPGSGVKLARLSVALAETGKADDAAGAAARAVALSGRDSRAYTLAGRAMLRANRGVEGTAYLNRAIQINPHDLGALTALGEQEAALGKRPEAAALFQRALAVWADYPPAKEALARLGG